MAPELAHQYNIILVRSQRIAWHGNAPLKFKAKPVGMEIYLCSFFGRI